MGSLGSDYPYGGKDVEGGGGVGLLIIGLLLLALLVFGVWKLVEVLS